MSKRVAVGKKVRFDVLKRDRFTCRYCGGKAPDVLLHVDHIISVKEGGTNDIENLVSACQSCNAGKGAVLLSVNQTLEASRVQLESSQEEIEQLEMMLDWRKSLSKKRKELTYEYLQIVQGVEKRNLNYFELDNYEKAANKHGFELCLKYIDEYIENRNNRLDHDAKEISYADFIGLRLNSQTAKGKKQYLLGIVRNRTSIKKLNEFKEWLDRSDPEIDFLQRLIDTLRAYHVELKYLNEDMFDDWWHPEVKRERGECCDYHSNDMQIIRDMLEVAEKHE